MPSKLLILCCLLLLPSVFPSIWIFSSELVLHIRWPKYWSFSFSISPSNEYSGQISFRMDWLDLLAVQGTLKSLLQHHSSVLQHSTFFVVQLSYPYMATGKTIALTIWTFVGKVISVLFNTLSGFVIAFLSRNKCLFDFMAAVTIYIDFGAQENKICQFPSICHEVMGLGAMIFFLWMFSFKPAFSLSSFTFIKRLFSSSSLSAIRVVSSTYLKFLMFLPEILISVCNSSNLAFYIGVVSFVTDFSLVSEVQ